MMRTLLTTVALLAPLCCSSAGLAQEEEGAAFDPSPFLSSMIALRGAAVTCDPFVANSPGQRTAAVPEFFSTLKQTLPELVDAETQASLNRFVGSQAAVLCRDKLQAAYTNYGAQVRIYAERKPEDWPEPPEISSAAWCSSEHCLEF
ncbi:hypothetical protein [Devosia sp. RR2S18]|jgi:hypothetical protein|uniref:hypothetical protein n=1 Tax=Devosia rhizosphaerae TaxID=3049774 RepID=UPI0025403E8B|nr:hypothetical protein [Devosia sp. RR2S18]WIJ25025.1 hypothetical protein QOV41_18755 [Devosia sp. RR2S18]HEV7291115.1 hypothetical protein [Devosia sp.]